MSIAKLYQNLPPAWMLTSSTAPPAPKSSTAPVQNDVPPPPAWVPGPAVPDTPGSSGPGPSANVPSPIVGTQSSNLPPLAPDAQQTAMAIIAMLAEYNATKSAPRVNWLFDNRGSVVALACCASGLNRRFEQQLPNNSNRIFGAFAMNERYLTVRLNEAAQRLGPLAAFAPRPPPSDASPEIRRAVSLEWPGQLYHGLVLLDTFRDWMGQLAIPDGPEGALIALWAFWRASSPENQRLLVSSKPDESRCREAIGLVRAMIP